ncbi:outer spore coat copper-dependent laccase CotA [Pseudonocardia aurantiaca]
MRPPVAIPSRDEYPGSEFYEITMLERSWQFHRDLGRTTTWGYWATDPSNRAKPIGLGYLGPTIIAHRNNPVVVNYRNHLPTTHLFQDKVDEMRRQGIAHGLPDGVNVPTTVHYHGGFTPPHSDGMAPQWYTPDGIHGPDYATLDEVQSNEAIYGYGNDHEAFGSWYHDHAMAVTRLNVYAGLAAVYLLRDNVEKGLNLPQDEFEVPLILQDKTFSRDGTLLYTLQEQDGGETAVVNGKAYPFLAVEPRRYRLRILDASNSRFWRLCFDVDGRGKLPFWLISTDDGRMPAPLQLTSILLAPAERADVIIDFSRLPMGTKVTLANDAPVHFPNGGGPEIPELMQFQVTEPLSSKDRTTPPTALVLPPRKRLKPTPGIPRREFTIIQQFPEEHGEMYDPENPYLINALPFAAPNEDFIQVGTTEIWEYINLTHDAHPMHNHLVQFQVYNRQRFNRDAYLAAYLEWVDGGREPAAKPVLAEYLVGDPIPPRPDEAGPKDTVQAHVGLVTRIIQRFDVPGGIEGIPDSGTTLPARYMHHCHILEHEDNDKMRPWEIVARPSARERLQEVVEGALDEVGTVLGR